MVTTDDAELDDRLRVQRNQGMRTRYTHEELGTNFRPTDIAAAIGQVQLAALDGRAARRRANAARLSEGLRGLLTPGVPDGREHAWHQYTVRFPGQGQRDRVAQGLAERGIESRVYYPVPIHHQPYLAVAMPAVVQPDLPVTDRLAAEVLSLPVRPDLTEAELEEIIAAVRDLA